MSPSDPHGQSARLSNPAPNGAANELDEPTAGGWRFRHLLMTQLSWMTSAVVHGVILLFLALLLLPEEKRPWGQPGDIEVSQPEEVTVFDEFVPPPPLPNLSVHIESANPAVITPVNALTVPQTDDLPGPELGSEPGVDNVLDGILAPGDFGGSLDGGGYGGGHGPPGGITDRRLDRDLLRGTPEDFAVAAALRWLAEHQLPDGGWSFDHTRGTCQGRCANAGSLTQSRRAATGMALMTFLGAGQTHLEGNYKTTVKRGLAFLLRNMAIGNGTGSLEEAGGSMYAHGLASIALCEAYAMSQDRGLMQPAQFALNHIAYAQDPVGGGWRYRVHQPGDTSVVGWQFMALKSGHMAFLKVNPQTVRGAVKFLDSVQTNSGANYGYTGPGTGAATTSIGLLCRMYAGWNREHPALERGAQWLGQRGPSQTDMYYNYYATQVLHHFGGELWEAWDEKMKSHLLKTQSQQGHQTGSWYFADPHGGSKGGRLYGTTLATMILEVYYRYSPIYQKTVVDDDFQL